MVLGSQNPLGNGSKGVVANPPLSFSKTLSCPPQSPCWPSHPDAVHSPQIFQSCQLIHSWSHRYANDPIWLKS